MEQETQKIAKSIDLVWVTVKDLNKAVQFYTETLGFHVTSMSPEFGWAEVQGEGGVALGLGQESPQMNVTAGSNAIVAITVDNLQKAKTQLEKKGVKMVGDIQEVPNVCKLQLAQDIDGNLIHLVENLS